MYYRKIPKEIGKLINLEFLSLSSNKLSLEIPKEIGKLINLQIYLYLIINYQEKYPKKLKL